MLQLLIYIFVFYCFLTILWNYFTSLKYPNIRSPMNIPIFGSTLHLSNHPPSFFKQMHDFAKSFDFVYILWFGWVPLLVTARKEYAEYVLGSQLLTRKSPRYDFFHDWLGMGVFTSYGKKWKARKRILTPSFHFAILKNFIHVFEKHSMNLVKRFDENARNNTIIDIQEPIALVTLENICETAMGVTLDTESYTSSEYIKAVATINHELQIRQRSPWLWPNFIYPNTNRGKTYYKSLKVLHEFSANVINEKINSLTQNSKIKGNENNENVKMNFLDTLIDLYKNNEIDVDGIREEVETFMFGGHDTVAAAVSWCLYLLGSHPKYQKTLQDEIDEVKGESIYEKVCNMNFLDIVIKESLRLYPSAPVIARAVDEEMMINNHSIKKGTEILIDIYSLHRNPSYWINPNQFNPYRFVDNKQVHFTYIPFSAGIRNCIGQKFAKLEMKVFIFNILKNYDLKSMQSIDEVEPCLEIIMRSNSGILMQFNKRSL